MDTDLASYDVWLVYVGEPEIVKHFWVRKDADDFMMDIRLEGNDGPIYCQRVTLPVKVLK